MATSAPLEAFIIITTIESAIVKHINALIYSLLADSRSLIMQHITPMPITHPK